MKDGNFTSPPTGMLGNRLTKNMMLITVTRTHLVSGVETQDHLVALQNRKCLMQTNLLQAGTSEDDSETA